MAFFLSIRCQDRQHQLTIGAFAVDVLFFKENVDAQRFELPDRFQQRNRVSGESGYGLGDDHIYFVRLFDTM